MIEKYKALEAKNERLKALNVELTAKCNWYNGDGARLERERDELTRQHEAYVKMLGELLAVLHADGGHYRYEHGTEKAVADAITKYYELVKQLAEHKADAERYRNIKPIIDDFPEINPSNYDHDDAYGLNAWGVELVLADEAMKGATE